MKIDGYNPYKKGFDMLVADMQIHGAKCGSERPFNRRPVE